MRRWLTTVFVLALAGFAAADEPIPVEFAPVFQPDGKPLEGLVITVDAGHGGSAHQPGYSGSARGVKSRVVEGDLNLRVALLLDHLLRQGGAEVHLTRRDDRKVVPGDSGRVAELGARTALADKTASHLFLSLHHNSAGRETAHGVVILIWPRDKQGNDQPLERAFAAALKDEIRRLVPNKEDFDSWENQHPLVSLSDIPSAVVEFGFLSNPEFDEWVSRPRSAMVEAEAAYRGVVRMWLEHRQELDAKRKELFPGATTIPSVKIDKPSPHQQAARTLWTSPTAPSSVAEVNRIIELYRRLVLSDRTLFHLEAKFVDLGQGKFRLEGRTNLPVLGTALVEILKSLGTPEFEPAIESLPSKLLGDSRTGIVQVPMALTWSAPREGAGVQTQLLLGQPVWLLDRTDDGSYFLLQSVEGYVGWARSEAIRVVDVAEFKRWVNAPKAVIPRPRMIDDVLLPAGIMLPYRLDQGETTTSPVGGEVTLELPRGFRATAGNPETRVRSEQVVLSPEDRGRRIANNALALLYTPYLFGGRSPQGIDCSGLTGVAYAAEGLILPRDAFQQIMVGQLVGAAWDTSCLRPGDLLFFVDVTGRVIHAGVSIGGARFVHASPPLVQVNSLDPSDPLYSKTWHEAFCFAKRPLP